MSLRELVEAHGGAVEFLQIYIREAHPTDGWFLAGHHIRDPRSLEERRAVAERCEAVMGQGLTTLVDDMLDSTMKAYAAWPDRLYLVGVDGRIRFAGERGPGGFRLDKLRAAIENLSKV